jgi:hypothetical protein
VKENDMTRNVKLFAATFGAGAVLAMGLGTGIAQADGTYPKASTYPAVPKADTCTKHSEKIEQCDLFFKPDEHKAGG